MKMIELIFFCVCLNILMIFNHKKKIDTKNSNCKAQNYNLHSVRIPKAFKCV